MIKACFDPEEFMKIDTSRWIGTEQMVVVDNQSKFDLEILIGASGTVDFLKDLQIKKGQST